MNTTESKLNEGNEIKKQENLDPDLTEKYIRAKTIGTDYTFRHKVVWKNAIGFLILHLLALWGLYRIVIGRVHVNTTLWGLFVGYLCIEGITIGAHRYYAHRTFSATPLLRAILVILQTLAGQNSVYIWCRDHRLHHRYSDTDADPHNSKRGFFFSHVGWLMSKKHPYVIELGKRIDMSDLEADWIVMFQKKYYYPLYIFFAIFIPVWVPMYYFGETFMNSFLVCYFTRYLLVLNGTWLVNSAAHLYGTRPYDKNLQPVESWFVSFLSLGEGWHNYHHTFPWDYKAAELSTHFNFTARLIKMCEKIGLAYNLKTASPEMVEKRIMRTGDGTHHTLGDEDSKASVTAIGPLHPLNPSYKTIVNTSKDELEDQGWPLFHERDVIMATSRNIYSKAG